MYPEKDSLYVQRAKKFLNKIIKDAEWHTINYLIQNKFIGIDKTTSIEDILQYLKSQDIEMNREQFQQKILVNLKRKGIITTLIYSGKKGGVFIPNNEREIRKVAIQVLNRIDSEITNLFGISKKTSFSNIIKDIKLFINKKIRKLLK